MVKEKKEKAVVKKTEKVKKTVKKVEKKDNTPKESYLKGVRKEMKLVKWPTGKEVLKNTIATIVLCAFICGFFLLLNLLLSVVKGWLM